MTTYTVLNMEMDNPETDEHVSGLTLEEAARLLIERARSDHVIRADGSVLWLAEARDEDLRKIVEGETVLPGPYIAVPDEDYAAGSVE